MTVKTRFAPSPTGMLHIGGARTALFSWLQARHHHGKFILRIEDTDRERSTAEAIRVILDAMEWLRLDYDAGPYYQSQRFDRYRAVILQLLDSGSAYYCNCSRERLQKVRDDAVAKGEKPRYDGHCRSLELTEEEHTVIRFKTPVDGEVIIDDKVQGPVIYKNKELDDLVIARSDGTPTYNLTVVVDDLDMGITDVIRGDDHLNNTPRQINIIKALDGQLPDYAHIPMILGSDGKKLSKRDGVAGVLQYRDDGYLPEAVLNYLVRLGWSKGDQEVFSVDEMCSGFDVKDVNKSAAGINPGKLTWLNQHYLKETVSSDLAEALDTIFRRMKLSTNNGPGIIELIAVQKQRVKTLKDMAEQSIFFYRDFDEYDAEAAKKHLRPVVLKPVQSLYASLDNLQDWNNQNIKKTIAATAENFGVKMGKLAQAVRVAVTGTSVSPGIDDTLRLLGKEKTLRRLQQAIKFIESRFAS